MKELLCLDLYAVGGHANSRDRRSVAESHQLSV
jgi:hypothetical protein